MNQNSVTWNRVTHWLRMGFALAEPSSPPTTHIQRLDEELAGLLREHQDAVQRLAAVPVFGVDSAQQIIAEVGPTAAPFPSAKRFASWVGACPETLNARRLT